MLRLYLLRHGKSDWNAPQGSDHSRPLAARGRRAARRVGTFLSGLGQEPNSIVSSTAVRAHETAKLAAAAGSWNCTMRSTDNLYLPAPSALLAEAREESHASERLMLVGHEPAWSDAVELFIGGGRVKMVTAALARIDFPVHDWSRIDFGQATLAWIVTPKLLGPSVAEREPESGGNRQ